MLDSKFRCNEEAKQNKKHIYVTNFHLLLQVPGPFSPAAQLTLGASSFVAESPGDMKASGK